MYKFTTIISKEGKWYVARCVELGVISQGKTIEDAEENLKEAVGLYLENMPTSKKYLSTKAPLITILEVEHVSEPIHYLSNPSQ
jgi:predicted RNase H-like HicB family nuclease